MGDQQQTGLGELSLAEHFVLPVSHDRWQSLAEQTLKGKPLASLTRQTHEGTDRQPLYVAPDDPAPTGYPGLPPFTRGNTPLGNDPPWQICQRIAAATPGACAGEFAAGRVQGAAAVWLVTDRSCRLGNEPVAGSGDGLQVTGATDLAELFARLGSQQVSIFLGPGGNPIGLTAAVVTALGQHRQAQGRVNGNLGCDPLGALAADGELPASIDRSLALMAELVRWTGSVAPGLQAITLSSLPYHQAGATAVQELALVVATGAEYLRALDTAGIAPADACGQIGAQVAVGRDLFTEIAKLRALRRLWYRVMQVCGVADDACRLPIHAVASPRTLTIRDPWVNLLRGTVEAFAAACGGAETITVLPFDSATGPSSLAAGQLAVNTQTILQEESRLGRVVDPAGGSWYVEQLTGALAGRAWALLQRIETAGGMRQCLVGGRVAEMISEARQQQRLAVALGRDPITGVSSFPDLDEQLPEPATKTPRPAGSEKRQHPANELARLAAAAEEGSGIMEAAIAAVTAGATVAQVATAIAGEAPRATMTPLLSERDAAPFEELRDAADRHRQETGSHPQVFLANIGAIPEHRTRATFIRSFLAAGGLRALDNDGFDSVGAAVAAFSASGVAIAAICSSDRRYQEVVPELAAGLRQAGARSVLLVGSPGEHEPAWRQAGIDRFVSAGCNMLHVLTGLQTAAGVRR